MPLHIACVLRACEMYALQAAVDDLLRDLVVQEVQMPLRCRHICNIKALLRLY
jgi:hypothetical protein